VRQQTDSPGGARFNGLSDAVHTFVCTLLTSSKKEYSMNRIVYLVGAVVIIIALLSFFGLR